MAWTTPRTWVANEVVTAAIMNTHVRDNLNDLDSRVNRKPFIVWLATANQPPATTPATPAIRNGHPVLEYDDTTSEDAMFGGVLAPSYDGGGLTIDVYWMAATATSGDVLWNAYIEPHTPDVDDLDSDNWGTPNGVANTTASASGELIKTSITFTDGADMNNLAAGESFRLRIRRSSPNVADTMTGDAQLLKVVLRET